MINVEKNIYFQKRYKIENMELKNIANSFMHGYYKADILVHVNSEKPDRIIHISYVDFINMPYAISDIPDSLFP